MAGQTLGFVGVGRMGGPMAGHLLDAGHSLVVCDTDAAALKALTDRGAEAVGSPAEVASAVETVFLSLPTPAIVLDVVTGANGLVDGSKVRTVVDLSTTGPTVANQCAEALSGKQVAWVDSPVSGGVPGAQKGTLAVMVSGPKRVYDELTPLLEKFGKLFFTGEKPGLAQVVKLGNNIMSGTALVISAEALAMGVKAGVDPKVMIDVINAGSGRNSATEDKFGRSILNGKFDGGFALALAYKDARLCTDEAKALGVPMLIANTVCQLMAMTGARFGEDADATEIVKLVEEWAGCEIRS